MTSIDAARRPVTTESSAVTLKVVGAGVGRTGTHSLKDALQVLLGGACHHMIEVFKHPESMALWVEAKKTLRSIVKLCGTTAGG